MRRDRRRALRITGRVLAALGAMAAFGGGLGVVLVEAQFAAIQCPEDPSCVDRMMGRGLYGTLAMVGLVVAAVGGLVVLASPRRRRRHTR